MPDDGSIHKRFYALRAWPNAKQRINGAQLSAIRHLFARSVDEAFERQLLTKPSARQFHAYESGSVKEVYWSTLETMVVELVDALQESHPNDGWTNDRVLSEIWLGRVTPKSADNYVDPRLERLTSEFAEKVASWFAERFAAFRLAAALAEFSSGNARSHHNALKGFGTHVAHMLRGGVYSLDADGEVIAQYTPHITIQNIVGQKYKDRPYFAEAKRLHRTIVSNSFNSAQRHIPILVIASPIGTREDFKGIVDGVIDIESNFFAADIRDLVRRHGLPDDIWSRFDVLLLDANAIVLACTDPSQLGRPFYGLKRATLVGPDGRDIESTLSLREDIALRAVPVEGTPFTVVLSKNR